MEIKKEKFEEKIKTCMQNEPAFCTAVCPFHLDIQDFIPKMQRGGFNAAYRTYLNAVGFPTIVSELCHEPCKNVCPRSTKDEAINMKMLEKSSIKYARNLEPNNYSMIPKNKKIAIIGAGISGLGCALRLASKKYDVTVFEKTHRIGGHLNDLMAPEIFLKDIDTQFKNENYTLCLNREITDIDEIKAKFDAVYVATGNGGNDFGLYKDANADFASNMKGVFLGGMLCGKNIIESLADGLQSINAIERYLKTGSMNHPVENFGTKIKLNMDLIEISEPIRPLDGNDFTKENAVDESKRCLRCSCDACVRHCDLMKYYGKYPKRIGEEAYVSVNPGTLDGNGTVATRLISTCNQCGLCKEVCPEKIDTGDYLLQSHHAMRERGAMPWAFHYFWLRDMDFTNGNMAGLCKLPNGYDRAKYVFFPGCQMGASEPKYVIESYKYLLKHESDTALMLGCCGAPSDWAGDEKLHEKAIEKIKNDWISIGRPTVIFGCTTCSQMFNKYLPEIKGEFLYVLMEKWGIEIKNDCNKEIVSVFDPCTSRHETGLHKSIRNLASEAGFELKPLHYEGKYAKCCSWGGQVSTANPSFAKEVVKSRISSSENPYISYCVNCRDIFAASKKPVYHILDILFSLHGSNRIPPTFTQRRKNRIILKKEVLLECWKEEMNMEQWESEINLFINPELKNKLSNEMILETEVEDVIKHCESTKRKVFDSESEHYMGHLKIGNMTFWVEYAIKENGFELFNAYAHRMSIEE